jgi:uncharacterized membrane protein YhaH (DUF805 family)
VDFAAAVGSAFRRAGDFKGRSSRHEYWYFFLLNFMILVSTLALEQAGAPVFFRVLALIWSLVALVPGLSVFIRRLRDAGYSPWMSLFVLAGPLGAVVFLVLLCQRSTTNAGTSTQAGVPLVPNGAAPSDPHDLEAKRRASAILLGFCVTATIAIVLGSITFAASQASILEAETQASASRVAVAASSRAAAASSASVSAEASRRAAALAETSRIEKLAQDLRDAEASRTAAASRSAAATAQAYASARDKLVAAGWSEVPDRVFYQWVPNDQVKCSAYQRCVQLKVTAPDGCPNGVSVEASEMTKGTVTGSASGYSPGFLQGQNALVTLTTYDDKADNVSIKKMTCR